jgi:hypothetical protein
MVALMPTIDLAIAICVLRDSTLRQRLEVRHGPENLDVVIRVLVEIHAFLLSRIFAGMLSTGSEPFRQSRNIRGDCAAG